MRKILDAIFSSVDDCPLQIREVLGHLQADVISRYDCARYSATAPVPCLWRVVSYASRISADTTAAGRVLCRFPEDVDIRYSAVGGFIFLRFFGPAILGPKLFGLRPDFADSVVGRTLTLAAKVLQVRTGTFEHALRFWGGRDTNGRDAMAVCYRTWPTSSTLAPRSPTCRT